MRSPPNLDHFVQAQDPVWDSVQSELAAGRKRSHWMWFVFPQIHGLGHSDFAKRYAIRNRAEATAYLRHPVLGPRLHIVCELLLGLQGLSAHDVLGSPDDLKLRSSMTLFAEVSDSPNLFEAVLHKYFDDEKDVRTLQRLD